MYRTAIAATVLLLSLHAATAGRPQWLDVPYVSQSRDGCGAAAIAMVMQYWMRSEPRLDPASADDARIYAQLASPGRKGIAGQKLQQYLEQTGFTAHVFRGDTSDLLHNLQQGRPIVTCIAPRKGALLHYVVVVGVSSSSILYHDPARGKLIEHNLSSFLRQWEPTGYWSLLATPRPPQ